MWYVYILECENNHFYTGITNDINQRFQEHKSGRGGRFTRVFGAKKILYFKEYPTKSQALKREAQIKGWTRKKKLMLIHGELI